MLANLALAGIPQLAIPLSMENYMEARCAVSIRCGLMLTGPDFSLLGTALDSLLNEPIYKRAAQSLAEKYARSNAEAQTQQLRQGLCKLIS